MGSTTSREQRFRELYAAAYVDLLRFARRRVHPGQAEDLVGEVFLVAWRRLDDVPAELSDARAWLFGVARNVLLSVRRREDRQDAVVVRLAEVGEARVDNGEHHELVATSLDLSRAWRLLSVSQQEAIALATLDGLNAPQAARVLGITPTAFRLRLSRARRALRQHMDGTAIEVRSPTEGSRR